MGCIWQLVDDGAGGGSFSGFSWTVCESAARGIVHPTGTSTWLAPLSLNGISFPAVAVHAAEADGWTPASPTPAGTWLLACMEDTCKPASASRPGAVRRVEWGVDRRTADRWTAAAWELNGNT